MRDPMERRLNLEGINAKIHVLKETAEELRCLADIFPAVLCNTDRILASIKMLELNVSDVLDLEKPGPRADGYAGSSPGRQARCP